MRNDDEIRDVERLFALRGAHGRFEPNADVQFDERERAIVVHVELAGADADSLRVEFDDVHLVIAGTRALRDVSRHVSLLRKEIQFGPFLKRIPLPVPVSDQGASAVYRDGILAIRLPLAETRQHPIVRTEVRMTVRRTLA